MHSGSLVRLLRYVVILLVITFLVSVMFYPYCGTLATGSNFTITKKWEKLFHGDPTTDIIVYRDDRDSVVLGTSMGIVLANMDGIKWARQIGGVMVNPLIVSAKIVAATDDRLYILSVDGEYSSYPIPNIESLLECGGYLVISTEYGGNTTISICSIDGLQLDVVREVVTGLLADYVLCGDINGDGAEDVILLSRSGRMEVYGMDGGRLYSVDMNVSLLETIEPTPVVGDIDGDSVDEVVIATCPIRGRFVSRILIFDNGSLEEYMQLGRRIVVLSLYDFTNDDVDDISMCCEASVCVVDFLHDSTVFNISIGEEFRVLGKSVEIADYDEDSAPEIAYISIGGYLVIANMTGVEKYYTPMSRPLSFGMGTFDGENMGFVLLLKNNNIVFVDGNMAEVSRIKLLGSPDTQQSVVYSGGYILIPLTSGDLFIGKEEGFVGIIENIGEPKQTLYGDFDGDGKYESLALVSNITSSKMYIVDGENIHEAIMVSGDIHGVSAADLDRDGRDEIIYSIGSQVVVIGSINRTVDTQEELATIPPIVYDYDNDLDLEILVVSLNNTVYIISGGAVEGKFTIPTLPTSPMVIGDINLDRGAEILFVDGDRVVCSDTSGRMWEYAKPQGEINMDAYLTLTDRDGDGFLETIMAVDNNISVYDHTGRKIDSISISSKVLDYAIVDIGNDWIQDIIILSEGKLEIKNLLTGESITNPIAIDNVGEYAKILAGDFDEDDMLEIVVISRGITYLEANIDVRGGAYCYGINKMMTFNTLNYDRDNDMLTEYEEMYLYGTNPYLRDTDGDGFDDRTEILNGWDPCDPSSPPRYPIVWISLALSIVALVVVLYIFLRKPKKETTRKE